MSEIPEKDSENTFQKIVDIIHEGLIVVTHEGLVHYLNPAAKEILKLLPEELFNEGYDWTRHLGKTVEFEHPNPGGEPSVVEAQVVEATWEGEAVFILCVSNITERKHKENMMRLAKDDAEKRASELEVMRFVAEQLNKTALLDDTIQAGLEAVKQISSAEAAWVLLQEEGGIYRLGVIDRMLAEAKIDKSSLSAPETCSCLERFAQGRLNVPLYIPTCEWMAHAFPNISAETGHMSVPLKSEGKIIGLLNLVIPHAKNPSHNDVKLLETVGGQLASAIERARRLSATYTSVTRDQSLNTVSRTISSTLDLPTMLKNVLQLAAEMIGADAGALGILSSEGDNLTFPFLLKVPEELSEQHFPSGKGMFWEAIKNGKSILMDGYHGQSDGLPQSFSSDLQAALIAPIINADKCLGVISLYSMKTTKKFNNFDLMLVESLGRQAGLAIENAQLYFEVQMLTTSDPLTGLTNQLSFNNQGMKEVERSFRYNRPLGVVMVNVDNLPAMIEKYGADAEDAVLKSVAQCCGRSLRRVDILSRYGKDEFVLLLPETTLSNTRDVAGRLIQSVEKTKVALGKKSISSTVSVGIASLENREEVDLETLLARAEQALTDARLAGGNRVCTWKAED